MLLKALRVRNFRRLKNALVQIDPGATMFVGANNSGKTSVAQLLQMFLGASNGRFSIYDFHASCWQDIDAAGQTQPGMSPSLPTISIDLWFSVRESDLHRVVELLPSLEWDRTLVGVRLEYGVKNLDDTLARYAAAKIRASKSIEKSPPSGNEYHPWPKTLSDYLLKTLNDEYRIRSYKLDPAAFDANTLLPKDTSYQPVRIDDDGKGSGKPLADLIRIDFLQAQRHLADTQSSRNDDSQGRSEDLSKRFNKFYEKNLPKPEDDLEAMAA